MQIDPVMLDFKNIIIWRHAEAHPAEINMGTDDMARTLTPKGKQQAKRMADWLDKRLPNDLLLISSPAMRAYQTAQALKSSIRIDEALKPNANLQEVLAVLQKLNTLQAGNKNLLLVGHQPWIWQLVAHLTGFSAVDINIKKGAVWWLRQSSDNTFITKTHYNIFAVQSPGLLI
jgi:phosphohistidine phosphatase